MSKFSLARVPYYIAVAVYMGFVGLVCLINNSTSSGIMSDIYLILLCVSLALLGLSVYYLFSVQAGSDDELGVEVAGLPISKPIYYGGVIAVAIWRGIEGYQINHTQVGIHSVWGLLWIVASVAIGGLTYANYRSLTAKQATPHPVERSPWKQQ